VRLELDTARVPAGPDISPEVAMQSGEEYELLACMPASEYEKLAEGWATVSAVPLTVVGVVRADSEEATSARTPGPRGFDHFASLNTVR
jgi:thiamine monophosphate kinase